MTATAEQTRLTITKPGIYDNVPESVYHSDPVPGGSLSSTGARKLLPPSCPALFRHEQLHGPPRKAAFNLGRAAHELVLGVGGGIEVIDAPSFRTSAAQVARDEAYAAGKTPLLPQEYEQIHAMAKALRDHPVAGHIVQSGSGRAEQSLFWKDPATGVICRARLDWLPTPAADRRLIIGDYKTCRSAEPRALSRAVYEHGYHQQDDWYRAGARALGIADETSSLVFIFQEKTAPHLVTVVELDAEARRVGAERNRKALEIYARCTAKDYWPGYSDDIAYLPLPSWAGREHNEEFTA